MMVITNRNFLLANLIPINIMFANTVIVYTITFNFHGGTPLEKVAKVASDERKWTSQRTNSSEGDTSATDRIRHLAWFQHPPWFKCTRAYRNSSNVPWQQEIQSRIPAD